MHLLRVGSGARSSRGPRFLCPKPRAVGVALKPFFLFLALILLGSEPLLGQKDPLLEEMGILAVSARSENPEFPSPTGFEIHSTWTFNRSWLFRISYHRMTDETDKVGRVCKTYAPHIACNQQLTHSDMALAGLRGGLLRSMVFGRSLRVGLGGGLSFNDVNADITGESGQRADLLAPKTSQVGYLALLSLDYVLPLPFPIRLSGGITSHWVQFHTCSGSNPPQYDPFCTMSRFQEGELGLSMAF
jgi:hypothetical protein